jgi:hypothetical protein
LSTRDELAAVAEPRRRDSSKRVRVEEGQPSAIDQHQQRRARRRSGSGPGDLDVVDGPNLAGGRTQRDHVDRGDNEAAPEQEPFSIRARRCIAGARRDAHRTLLRAHHGQRERGRSSR